MTMGPGQFDASRKTMTYTQTIDAAPEAVFPLICPVREAEWLDGWTYDLVYSESGLAEEGAVFSTPGKGEEDTVWVITRHDREALAVDFTRFTPGSRTCVLKVGIRPNGEDRSFVDISYTYTAVTPEGNDFLGRFTEDIFLEAVQFWEDSMNHFLKSGELLRK